MLPMTNLLWMSGVWLTSLLFAQLSCVPHWRVLKKEPTDGLIQEGGGRRDTATHSFHNLMDCEYKDSRSDLGPRACWEWQSSVWRLRSVCVQADWQQSWRQHDQWSTCLPLMAGGSVTDMDGRISCHFLWFLVKDPTVWAFGASWFLAGACPALLGVGRCWL